MAMIAANANLDIMVVSIIFWERVRMEINAMVNNERRRRRRFVYVHCYLPYITVVLSYRMLLLAGKRKHVDRRERETGEKKRRSASAQTSDRQI